MPRLLRLWDGGAGVSDDKNKLPIRVSELVAALQALPQDAFVLTEGCDCYGPCGGAELLDHVPYFGMVLLGRDENRDTPRQSQPPRQPVEGSIDCTNCRGLVRPGTRCPKCGATA